MPKFNYNLRNPKASRPTPVYLIIRHQKYRVVFPTGEKVLPENWDGKNQCQKTISNQYEMGLYDLTPDQKKQNHIAKNFNQRLSEIQGIAQQVFDNFLKQNDNEEPDPKEYKLLLEVELEKRKFARKDLFTFMKSFIEEKKRMAIEEGTEHHRGALFKNYAQLYTHLSDYTKHFGMEIDFRNIDIDFYYNFADYLRNRKNLLPNTIGKHFKSLKTILNSATDGGLNSNMSYKSKLFKVITEKVDTLFLDESELASLAGLDLSGEILLDQVRDIFLISARTGLRDSEFSRIHAILPDKGIIEIADSQNKDIVPIHLHANLISIMDKHKALSETELPPVISNVQMNTSIKEVCKKIPHFHEPTDFDLIKRIKGKRDTITNAPKYELISMQTARRSFFQKQYSLGTDIYILMGISGHSNTDNFLKFIHVAPGEHAANLRKKWNEKIT